MRAGPSPPGRCRSLPPHPPTHTPAVRGAQAVGSLVSHQVSETFGVAKGGSGYSDNTPLRRLSSAATTELYGRVSEAVATFTQVRPLHASLVVRAIIGRRCMAAAWLEGAGLQAWKSPRVCWRTSPPACSNKAAATSAPVSAWPKCMTAAAAACHSAAHYHITI